MSLWNVANATAKIVGESTLGAEDGYPTVNYDDTMGCNCNVSRQRPAGFKPVVETELEDGGTFYKFNSNNYETIKDELKPSLCGALLKFWEW